MLHRIGAALVVLLVLACASPEAWAGKVGPEFRVNTTTAEWQLDPSVAALSNGGFVVTWLSDGPDGFIDGVFVKGQLYSAAGVPVGGEFTISEEWEPTTSPSVAALKNGGFVVTWGYAYAELGFAFTNTVGQRYSAAGVAIGGAFRVNTSDYYYDSNPSVAGLSHGPFVVVWHAPGQDGLNEFDVYGQRFSRSGAPLGEFRVNTTTAGDQLSPSVAGLSDGGFVVIWTSRGQDGSGYGVYGQWFSAAGRRVGSEFRVNKRTALNQREPSVAALSNGGFVVTWISRGQDGSGDGVYGQRYNAAGARVGSEFRVNTRTALNQREPSVAGLSDGGFVVTWTAVDAKGRGVFAQRYSPAGLRVGREFRVNTYTKSDQRDSSVAGLSKGGFVVTWTSRGQDGSDDGVYGQRFSP